MIWNSFKTLCLVLAGSLAFSMSHAAGLSDGDIPTDSNWYFHMNLEGVRQSNIGRQFMLETFDEAMDDIEDELGVDVREEFEGITIFGGQLPQFQNVLRDGAVIFHGVFSDETRAAFLTTLNEKGAGYREEYESGMTYYVIDEDMAGYIDEDGELKDVQFGREKELYFSFGSTQTIVTQSPEIMQVFLSGGGYLGGFSANGQQALMVLQADRSLLQGGANTSDEITGEWDSSIFNNIDAIAMVVSEFQDGLQLEAKLTAVSEEAAMSVRNIVEGMVALKALNESGTAVGDALRNIRFENQGAVLHANVQLTAAQIAALKD